MWFEEGSLHRCQGRCHPSLAEAQQSQSRLCAVPEIAGNAKAALGGSHVATETVDLGVLVVGRPGGRMGWFAEPGGGALGRCRGAVPRAVEAQQLSTVHEALAAVGDEVGLRVAPIAERSRPLLGAPQIEVFLAQFDHGAVDDAGHDRRDLAGGDRDHRLVEQRHPLAVTPVGDECLARAEAAEGGEVVVTAACAGGSCLLEADERRVRVAGDEGDERISAVEVARSTRTGPCRSEELAATREPAMGRCQLSTEHQTDPQPEDAPQRGVDVAIGDTLAVGSCPGDAALVVAPGEVGGDGQLLQIRRAQRRIGVGGDQRDIGGTPLPAIEVNAGLAQCRVRRRQLLLWAHLNGTCHRWATLRNWPLSHLPGSDDRLTTARPG